MTIRPEDEYVTIDYVASALQISKVSIWRLMKAGKLEAIQPTRKTVRITRLSFDRLKVSTKLYSSDSPEN